MRHCALSDLLRVSEATQRQFVEDQPLDDLFELAEALEKRYGETDWPLPASVRLLIRRRLDPEPFLALAPAAQLARLKEMSPSDVLGLHNAYVRWLDDGDEAPMSERVFARMLDIIEPEEHLTAEQHADLRDALKPEALAAFRAAENEKIQRLLSLTPEERAAWMADLDPVQLGDLKVKLRRYASELGRSPSWRDTMREVKAAAEAARTNPRPPNAEETAPCSPPPA